MQNSTQTVVVLGTGGTIAGTSSNAADNVGYSAAQIGVAQLVRAVPALAGVPIELEQVAQIDSKDMAHAVWRALALRCAAHLARPEVAGIVVTHGTDTLEETAWFLQRVLAPAKPVVLTGAMRPSTALFADGPQNLLDAVAVAQTDGARGVVAVMAARVHGARDVTKRHPYRVDAFDAGEAGPIGVVEEGRVRLLRAWPEDAALLPAGALPEDTARWPRVDIVTSHAGADGEIVRALVASGARGIVIAATGNGTVHDRLDAVLREIGDGGVRVLRSTRCNDGRIVESATPRWPSAHDLTPVKARVELLLQLLAAQP